MLEVGEYKNYKAICEAMGWEITSGNSKKKQLKELERCCKYHKEGNKFVIEEIYKQPSKNIKRKVREEYKKKNYPQFKVDEDKWYNKGVYIIKLDNQVYIGSTINFRNRFRAHLLGTLDYMKHTYKLLNNGGEFFILHDMSDIEDIELIRMIEEEYILFYTHETDCDVVNRRMGTFAYKKPKKSKKPKIKYKTIKIEEEYYEQMIKYYNELRGECDE